MNLLGHLRTPSVHPAGLSAMTKIGSFSKGRKARRNGACKHRFILLCIDALFLGIAFSAVAQIDLEQDGLSDIWQLVYGANFLLPAADTDGDGRRNIDESRAGTNPFSPADALAVRDVTLAGGQITLRWPSKLGKRYRVESAAALNGTVWPSISPVLAGTGAGLEFSWPAEPSPKFYRVSVFDTDTDGDGLTDWEELATGFDPNNTHTLGPTADDDKTAVTRALSLPNIVNVVAEDAAASEVGPDNGVFAITRTGNLNPITIHYAVSGSATVGDDYAALTSSVQLGVGVNRATIPLVPRADNLVEPMETVVVTLVAQAGYQLGSQTTASIQIADAPVPPPGQRTYFVKEDGSDQASGLMRTTAFRTIQQAANVVEPGDAVIVLPGVYSESVQLTRAGTAQHPVTFSADGIARGRVTISGARRDIRDNAAVWTLDTSLGVPGVYSTPLDYTPIRVLSDDIDLYGYQSVDEFKQLLVNNVAKTGKPGPGPRHGWVVNGGRLYVRLHPSGQYGSVNPSQHVMKVGPRIAAGSFGHIVEKPSDYNFGIITPGASYVVLAGFTFETPGLCGVYAPRTNVTIRDSWSIGCRALAAGTAADDYNDNCSDTALEYCEHTEQGTLQDMREIVDIAQTLPPATYATLSTFYWWHRKGGPLTYEYGAVACAGTRWALRHCLVHDTFDALSWRAVSWSRDLEVSSNVFANLADNAVETEEHAQGMRVSYNYIRDVWSPLSFQPGVSDRLANDIEFHHNVSYMSARQSAFWERLLDRQVASIFKLYSPGLAQVSLPGNGMRHHHNTFWHPSGTVYNTANVGDFMSGFSFQDNIVVARGLDYRRPDPPFPNYQFARNFVAPSAPSLPGPGAHFAGAGGAVYGTWTGLGLRDPASGDLGILPGSPAATGDATGQSVGAIPAGQTWAPPAAGPRLSSLGDLGPTGTAPIAVNDSATVALGSWVKVFVLANDSDANRDLLTLLSIGQGSFGSASIEGQQVIYTPGPTFGTSDTFNYAIGDGHGNTATASVTISRINAAPVAVADTVLAAPGAVVTVNVLANDTDADNNALTLQNFTQGAKGTVALTGNMLRYTPGAANLGADTFTYTVSDGQGGTSGTTVTIVTLPNPPVAGQDSFIAQNSEQTALTVLANDNDGNGGSTTVEIDDATHGAKGKVEIRAASSASPATIRYVPNVGVTGSDSFTYTIRNLSGQRATATVSVSLVNNTKPTLVADYYYANLGVPITYDVLSNDSDPDGDPLTISSLTAPTTGSATIVGNKVRYTGSALGWDSLQYTVSDGRGGTASQYLSVYVNP